MEHLHGALLGDLKAGLTYSVGSGSSIWGHLGEIGVLFALALVSAGFEEG